MRGNCCSSTQYLAVFACDPWNCCSIFIAMRKDITQLAEYNTEKSTWVLGITESCPNNRIALSPDTFC